MNVPRLAFVGAGIVSAALLSWLLASEVERPGARELTEIEREILLPALARSPSPGLARHRTAARPIVEKLASGRGVRFVEGEHAEAIAGPDAIPLPAGFLDDLGRMERALLELRRLPAPPEVLTDALAEAQRRMWSAMVAAQVVVKGKPYRVPRTAVVGQDGAVAILPEPVVDAVVAMEGARARYEEATAMHAAQVELWDRADPKRLFENLVRRDGVRHYDDGKRRAHLGLVLDALLPNLTETVTVDVGGVLEAALAGALPARPAACLTVRDATPLNAMIAHEDREFAAAVAPLMVLVRDDAGTARLTRIYTEGGKLRESAVGTSVPRE